MFLEQNTASPTFFHPNFILQMQALHEADPHNQQEHHSIISSHLPSSNPRGFSRGYQLVQLNFSRDDQLPFDKLAHTCHVFCVAARRPVSFSGNADNLEAEEELSDDCSQPGEKKRRLNMEQVRTLEKNFELGNKLEPERKIQLARALGLQPRQIAIWFQNRRARWKTKQLEKDYSLLRRRFEAIKSENDALQVQNKKLQAEILALKGMDAPELINLNKETEGSCSNRSENSCEIKLDISRTPAAAAAANADNQSIPLFPSNRQLMGSQILQSSSTPDLHYSKIADENLNNFMCGMEDQTAFWPWPDHHIRH